MRTTTMGMHNQQHNISDKPHDWPNFFRLVSISGVATICTVGNIFTISSIIVDDLLRKKGNSFLVSLTLADLLITSFVLPAISVAILAQTEDSENLCLFQYGVGCMSCVSAAIFTAAIGIDNFLRLRTLKNLESARLHRSGQQPVMLSVHILSPQPPEKQSVCSQFQVTVLNLTFWSLSAFLVLVHYMLMPQLTFAICGNGGSDSSTTSSPTRSTTTSTSTTTASSSSSPSFDPLLFDSILALGAFLLFFVLLGGLGFLKCVCIMRSWNKPLPYITSREFALINSNFWNWLVRFLIWCPSIVAAIVTQYDRSVASMSSSSPHEVLPLPTGRISSSSTSSTSTILNFTTTTFSNSSNNTNTSSILGKGGGGSEQDSEYFTLQRIVFWSAILPSCLASIIYACANKDFRRCYIQLFNYCCCKTSVTLLTRRPRDNHHGGSTHISTHIIPGYNIYSSGHNEVAATPLNTFTRFKCGGPIMNYRRDVYEL